MIRKTYFYGVGEAGVEENIDWEDFVVYQIQDDEAALWAAKEILDAGAYENQDFTGRVIEIFDCEDHDWLAEMIANEEKKS